MRAGSTLRRCQALLRPKLPAAYGYLKFMTICVQSVFPLPECKLLGSKKLILATTVTPVLQKQK